MSQSSIGNRFYVTIMTNPYPIMINPYTPNASPFALIDLILRCIMLKFLPPMLQKNIKFIVIKIPIFSTRL